MKSILSLLAVLFVGISANAKEECSMVQAREVAVKRARSAFTNPAAFKETKNFKVSANGDLKTVDLGEGPMQVYSFYISATVTTKDFPQLPSETTDRAGIIYVIIDIPDEKDACIPAGLSAGLMNEESI